jgi:hypothetical protein
VDPDYDLDTLDKGAVFHIPPVPVGSVDTAFLTGEGKVIQLPPGVFADFRLQYPIEGIFTEDIIDKFFFEGAETASLVGKIDVMIASINSDANIVAQMSIINEEGDEIDGFEQAESQLTNTANQDFALTIKKEQMHLMKDARGVLITFVFSGLTSVGLDPDDYLLLHDLVLKTGGMHFDF